MAFDRYCCLKDGRWHRVIAQSTEGVTLAPDPLDADLVWRGQQDAGGGVSERFVAWGELDVPLPYRGARCWGYALTYPEHRRETLKKPAFRFLKQGSLEPNSEPIRYRPFLDFELEIGVLMHLETPERFGYFLANDLTDRGLQLEHYDARNPAPGFTLAKDFHGSLRAGPLLVVGDASVWPLLNASLTLNGQERQTLRAIDCALDPRRLHQELFRDHEGVPWLMVITGTPGGTLFHAPQFPDRMRAMLAGGLSPKRARRSWVRRLRFLAPGDTLVLDSAILGYNETQVI